MHVASIFYKLSPAPSESDNHQGIAAVRYLGVAIRLMNRRPLTR
jgi:hypothetical protein